MRKLEGRFPDLPEFFRWDTHLYMSLFLSTCLSVHPSHTIFFRNHCDHKGAGVGRGVTGQKISQNEKYKLHLSCLVSQQQFSIWSFDHDFWYIYVTWHTSRHFFHLFKIFLFLCCYWGKRAKNGLKWQKILSILLHISGTIHHMILMYGTHGNFSSCFCLFCLFFVFIFSKFWFFRMLRGSMVEKGSKMTKTSVIYQTHV